MNKIINKKHLYIFLTCLWICMIFSFSLQSGEDSGQISSGFGAWLVEHVFSIFSDMFESMSVEQMDIFHLIIRKCAHFAEFFVLGVLMIQTLMQTKVVHKAGIGMLLCILVAVTDETIQLFVPGRAGMFRDVLLDSSGSLAGIVISYFLSCYLMRSMLKYS